MYLFFFESDIFFIDSLIYFDLSRHKSQITDDTVRKINCFLSFFLSLDTDSQDSYFFSFYFIVDLFKLIIHTSGKMLQKHVVIEEKMN